MNKLGVKFTDAQSAAIKFISRQGKKFAKPTAESVARRKQYPRRPVINKGKFHGTTARMIATHSRPNRHMRRYAAAIARSVRKLARSKNAGK